MPSSEAQDCDHIFNGYTLFCYAFMIGKFDWKLERGRGVFFLLSSKIYSHKGIEEGNLEPVEHSYFKVAQRSLDKHFTQ